VNEAEEVFASLLAEVTLDIQDALVAGDEPLRLQLKEFAEGKTRYAYMNYLSQQDRFTEAHAQLHILTSDFEFGSYSTISSISIGLPEISCQIHKVIVISCVSKMTHAYASDKSSLALIRSTSN
jgi:lysine/ornithine N-monooxygenase